MNKDIQESLNSIVNENMAVDALPKKLKISEREFAMLAKKKISSVFKKWNKTFEKEAERVANGNVIIASKLTRSQLKKELKRAGIAIEPVMSPIYEAKMQSLITENIELIKTIPSKYFEQLSDATDKAFAKGSDYQSLYQSIIDTGETTERKAELITRDQLNKATQELAIQECQDAGCEKGEWVHIPGAKSSRETHVAMNGEEFDLGVGMYDEDVGDYVMPGELVYCNCQFKPIIPDVIK